MIITITCCLYLYVLFNPLDFDRITSADDNGYFRHKQRFLNRVLYRLDKKSTFLCFGCEPRHKRIGFCLGSKITEAVDFFFFFARLYALVPSELRQYVGLSFCPNWGNGVFFIIIFLLFHQIFCLGCGLNRCHRWFSAPVMVTNEAYSPVFFF